MAATEKTNGLRPHVDSARESNTRFPSGPQLMVTIAAGWLPGIATGGYFIISFKTPRVKIMAVYCLLATYETQASFWEERRHTMPTVFLLIALFPMGTSGKAP